VPAKQAAKAPVKPSMKPSAKLRAKAPVVEELSGRSKRFTISVSTVVHEKLTEIARLSNLPIAGVCHAMMHDRTVEEMVAMVKAQPPLRNRGRARKFYHR